MENSIQVFKNSEFGEIRTIILDNDMWFVGIDVAKSLNYKDKYGAIRKNVDDEDKRLCPLDSTSGGTQKTTVINESGLYSLIFNSKLDSAKRFKKWVTSEVLPSIRKTGSYGQPQFPTTIQGQIQLLAQGNVELNQRVDKVENALEEIKNDMPILPIEAEEIVKSVKRKGVDVMGGKKSPAYADRSIVTKVYNSIYSNLKYNFDVRSYKSIRRKDTAKALSIIDSFQLPLFLAEEIDTVNRQQTMDI